MLAPGTSKWISLCYLHLTIVTFKRNMKAGDAQDVSQKVGFIFHALSRVRKAHLKNKTQEWCESGGSPPLSTRDSMMLKARLHNWALEQCGFTWVRSLGLLSPSVPGIKCLFRSTILMQWSCLRIVIIASFSTSGNSSNSLCPTSPLLKDSWP